MRRDLMVDYIVRAAPRCSQAKWYRAISKVYKIVVEPCGRVYRLSLMFVFTLSIILMLG